MEVINRSEAYQDAIRRIGELQELNSLLAEQVDRMRPVADAAKVLSRLLRRHAPENWLGTEAALERAVGVYERAMARFTEGVEHV